MQNESKLVIILTKVVAATRRPPSAGGVPYMSDRFAPPCPFAPLSSHCEGPLILCRSVSAAAEWRNTRRSVSGLRRACPTVFRFYPRLHFPVTRLSITVAPSSLPSLPPIQVMCARASEPRRAITLSCGVALRFHRNF